MKVKALRDFVGRLFDIKGDSEEVVLYNEGSEWSPTWKPLDPSKLKVEIKPTLQPETSEEEA